MKAPAKRKPPTPANDSLGGPAPAAPAPAAGDPPTPYLLMAAAHSAAMGKILTTPDPSNAPAN